MTLFFHHLVAKETHTNMANNKFAALPTYEVNETSGTNAMTLESRAARRPITEFIPPLLTFALGCLILNYSFILAIPFAFLGILWITIPCNGYTLKDILPTGNDVGNFVAVFTFFYIVSLIAFGIATAWQGGVSKVPTIPPKVNATLSLCNVLSNGTATI